MTIDDYVSMKEEELMIAYRKSGHSYMFVRLDSQNNYSVGINGKWLTIAGMVDALCTDAQIKFKFDLRRLIIGVLRIHAQSEKDINSFMQTSADNIDKKDSN